MIWRPWLLALPDDGIARDNIMSAMSAAGHWVTEPEPTNIMVLKIADPAALAVLRRKFADEPLRELDELTDEDELLMEKAHRPECERLLGSASSSKARWTPLMCVAVGAEASEHELLSLYAQCRQARMC